MSTTGWAAVIIALIIILAGGWWYMSSRAPVPTPADTTGTNAAGTIPAGSGTPNNGMVGGDASVDVGGAQTAGVTVHYGTSGFTPKTVTIKAGEKVTFVNDGTSAMWVASAEHPTHTVYDGSDRATHCSGSYTGATPFDQCQPGSTYTFVFTKAGTFNYHNHSAAQFTGTVVVQ